MTNDLNCLNFKSSQVSSGKLAALFLLLFRPIIYDGPKYTLHTNFSKLR